MILETWNRLAALPARTRIFSYLIRLYVPYTGSIRPEVLELRPGYSKVRIRDRRGVRNHLRSVHAVAMMNLAEAASGLALNAAVPPSMQAILVGFSIEFLKKARGPLTAECHCPLPKEGEKQEQVITAEVKNEEGVVVCKATARWLVGPKRAKA